MILFKKHHLEGLKKNLQYDKSAHTNPLQAGGGLIYGGVTQLGNAEGLERSMLNKLSLFSKPADGNEPSSPPRRDWNLKHVVSSPTTPLDLTASPTQSPLKKKKGAETVWK